MKKNQHSFKSDFTKRTRNPDSYRAKIDKPDKINTSRFPEGFKSKIIHNNPYIVKLRRFLNSEEVKTLLEMSEGNFNRSTIVVNGELVYSNVRTSETAFVTDDGHYQEYSKPIEHILEKVCYLAGCERRQIEGIMVVKYNNGEQYYDHHDFFEPEHLGIDEGGQRVATFFCYLSSLDKNEGGETEFPLLDLKIKPSKGTALFWWNKSANGNLLRKTLHRGNPVNAKNKIKYGLNIWVREKGW